MSSAVKAATVGGGRKPTGRSIVACRTVELPATPILPAEAKFYAVDPHSGSTLPSIYLAASADDVDKAGWRAWTAFHAMAERTPDERARLLEAIAQQILGLGDSLIAIAADETGLGAARLVSERERTVNTLRMFAGIARSGEWMEAAIETGQPSRRPVPKPDLRKILRPLGPVAVFGAGNFPLAYSTAGGDTASSLAAGCPVIVKGHPGHPGTGELAAQAVAKAVEECGFDLGTFSFLHSGGKREMEVGERLVRHHAIRAVGFTGSVGGGTALVRLAAERPDPIPVFAEMGSTNPVFALPAALEAQAEGVAERLFASATSANGQMCTCPGLLFVARGSGAESLTRALAKLMNEASPQMMLNRRTRHVFAKRFDEVSGVSGVELRAGSPQGAHRASETEDEPGSPIRCSPTLFRTSFEVFRKNPTLHDEMFGPALIIVVCEGEAQMADAAATVQGSLTGTIWAAAADASLARRIAATLEQRVGRLIFNGVPTGVEVSAAMVHGGPYPATSRPDTTAVGPDAIRRWARPVCFQNVPETFLPPELRNSNPFKIARRINGEWTAGNVVSAKA